MTETTSIQHFMHERNPSWPVLRQPGLATFIAQAAIGSFCGGFLVVIARMVLVYDSTNGYFVFYVPFLMALGLLTGAVAGFLIWAATRETDGPLLGLTRSLIGVLVTALAWFALWYFLLREEMTPDVNLWMLLGVVVSGVSIGWVTGSRLRPWRELVRGGETKTTLLKIIAGLIGLVLRVSVLLVLLATLIIAITSVQDYFLGPQPAYKSQRTLMVWYLLLLGHFAAGTIVLFARMKFWLLVPLVVIAASPVLASLWLAELVEIERSIVTGYLGVWAMFLLTRWRQTDIAWSYLREELRYYLID